MKLKERMETTAAKAQASVSRNTWKRATWKRCLRTVFRLQRRIWKAIREGNTRKARFLQKILIRLKAARMLAVRQVTQLNAGKKTAGVDGKRRLSNAERSQLVDSLKATNQWQHSKLRQVPIPKPDGTTRVLKIPTIADRAWQCLCKLVIEPAHEALFHKRSYGFRPGRSAHDAQKILFSNLNSHARGYEKRILELDIEQCFDRIDHKAILDRIIAPQAIKQGVFRCLKSGVEAEFPMQGTPQGGVISPLLANIALNGIEETHHSIRYADDMVFVLKPKDDATAILGKVTEFLTGIGLKVKTSKTKLVSALDGFNFLGWRFYVQANNGKFRSTPSTVNFEKFRKNIKIIVNNSYMGAKVKTEHIRPIVRGWRNYHRYTKLEGSRFSLWQLNHSTFRKFLQEKTATRYSAAALVRKAFPYVRYKENGHVSVKSDASPFDGNVTYWNKRNPDKYVATTDKSLSVKTIGTQVLGKPCCREPCAVKVARTDLIERRVVS